MRMRITVRVGVALLAACVLVALAPVDALGAGGGTDYVLLVDCTGTMQYSGRDEATLAAIENFIGALNEGDRVSVYGYGEEPFAAMIEYPVTIGPSTQPATVCEWLELPFNADRTDFTRGLDLVWQEREKVFSRALGRDGKAATGAANVILLTDGKLIPVYTDYSEYDAIYAASRKRLRELGALFADAGIPIHTVGLGQGDKLDGELLTQVSAASGGAYRHAASSEMLAGVFGEIADEVVTAPAVTAQSAPADVGGEEALMVAEPRPPRTSARRFTDGIIETASAGERTGLERAEAALAQSFDDVGRQVYQSIVGVLGVVMGFVAIGVHRRQSWTGAFTKPLLKKEVRVKGYLRRVLPEGVVAAHRNIPIENPGLPVIEIGIGTEFAPELRETMLEFGGTTDGSPPILRVLKGAATVDGEPVEEPCPLVDGCVIECEGKAYKYLRGQRR